MNSDTRPIGIFDSGVGGLTVAQELYHLLPHENTIYVGDTANVPYGAKSPAQLLQYAHEIIKFMISKDVKAVVIACGTSSAVTYDTLVKEYPGLPLIDVIRPGVAACKNFLTSNPSKQNIGMIATTATIKSGAFARLFEDECYNAMLYSQACPLFASMVESGIPLTHPALQFATRTYLDHLRGNIDALVLGCTHYPLLSDILLDVLGDIKLINVSDATATATKEALQYNGLFNASTALGRHEYYVTGNAHAFDAIGSLILGDSCEAVEI